MQSSYQRAQLNKIASDNYETLRHYCSLLEREGYWDGPAKVLDQSVYDFLDVYVQCVLVKLADFCGKLGPEERDFIGNLTRVNALGIDSQSDIGEHTLATIDRIFSSPPILFQLFGLRDQEKKTSVMGLFFDALLNIQLALAFINYVGMEKVTGFIRSYYYKIEVFLYAQGKYTNIINEKYIFLKLCNGVLEHSNEHLLEADQDFDYYKKNFLYMSVDKAADERKREEESVYMPDDGADPEYISDEDIDPEYLYDDEENIEEEEETESDTENEGTEEPGEQSEKEEKGETLVLESVPTPAPVKVPYSEQIRDEKIMEDIRNAKSRTKLEELMNELNDLVGLPDVKNEIKSLINLIKVRNLRKAHNLPDVDMSYHMVFTGSPGTGKTTVARLVAGIYRELGILSKGTLVETDRSGLVAGYVGQTALKVKDVVEKAVGGVLFIDEAYALSSNIGTTDFGEEAIETLVKLMEDHRDNLVVIVAGYTKEMQQFLKSNTGLMSRFNKFIEFKDYSDSELIDILDSMAKKAGFVIEDEALLKALDLIESMNELRRYEFGNARGIRNMFEKMVVNQANRIVGVASPDVDDLTHIRPEDVVL